MDSQNVDRGKIENALTDLTLLLEQAVFAEEKYQEWCEKYDIFEILDYKRTLVKPTLRISKKEFLVPDFMVQGIDDIWEIIDLKRPDTNILKDKSKRTSFYATFEAYYSQCRDYSQFFENERNRVLFEQEHNTKIQKYVTSIIVAGRNNGIDKRKINDFIFDRGSKVKFRTYDDIKNELELIRIKFYKKHKAYLDIQYIY